MGCLKKLWLLLILFPLISSSQSVKWMSLEDAVRAQKQEARKIIMDVYTDWCGPCKLMDSKTFSNPDVATFINKNYYAVKFNAEGNITVNFKGNTFANPGYDPKKKGRNATHELTSYMGIRGYPTVVFLDEEANFITPLVGYQTVEQLELYLKLFENDFYKSIKTQEEFSEYQTSFTPKFKG